MSPGTRVTHLRYPFLVGEVIRVDEPNEHAIVKWQQHHYSQPELIADLRPTPVQL